MKKWLALWLVLIVIIISGCQSQATGEEEAIKVGIRSSELRTWEFLQESAREKGLDIELITFSSAYDPNEALKNGEIDVNAFQHIAYLETFNEKTNSSLVPIGTTVIAPLGIYSDRYTSLDDIPEGAQIAIPNDQSNWGRALLLLQEAGFITVVDDFDGIGGEDKIKDNPKQLEIIPVDGFQTPRAMEDTGVSIINNGTAVEAGLLLKDALFHESVTAKPYINVIVTTEENKDDERLQQLVDLYQSEEMEKFIEETYEGNYIPTFISTEELATFKDFYSNKN